MCLGSWACSGATGLGRSVAFFTYLLYISYQTRLSRHCSCQSLRPIVCARLIMSAKRAVADNVLCWIHAWTAAMKTPECSEYAEHAPHMSHMSPSNSYFTLSTDIFTSNTRPIWLTSYALFLISRTVFTPNMFNWLFKHYGARCARGVLLPFPALSVDIPLPHHMFFACPVYPGTRVGHTSALSERIGIATFLLYTLPKLSAYCNT